MKRRNVPLLSASFVWHNAASHSDIEAFRRRQHERMARVQAKPSASVAQLKRAKQ